MSISAVSLAQRVFSKDSLLIYAIENNEIYGITFSERKKHNRYSYKQLFNYKFVTGFGYLLAIIILNTCS
jgi:hypothetical protein